jgi:eukaryotic-like serine/threonine-protein kinase
VLTQGDLLDSRYEILGPLAEGGMGEVYRARRTHLGDEVAIKIIKAGGADARMLRERFLRESRVCARLRHPHIVTILDFNVDAEGRPFLVMELLNGHSLREELEAAGRLGLERVQAIVPPLCSALQLAHDQQVLHRDLKPGNLVSHRFGSGESVFKIIDFGLANIREASDETRLTAASTFLGTVAYASPEQLRGESLDARSDIYSLGAVTFEMLTGRVPFEGTSALSVATGHLTGTPPDAGALRPELPTWVGAVLTRALARDPAARWPSMRAFGQALLGPAGATRAVTAAGTPQRLLATYALGPRIGSGRLGSDIYAGTHRVLGHPVAIRTLRRTAGRNWEAARGRFLTEARTLQAVHPSIIQVRDYGEDEDLVYVITDYVAGSSLRALLDRDGALPWPRLRPLVLQMAEAAGVLHRRGGLLCGLNPEIIRVTPASEEEEERLLISSAGICQVQDLLATLSDASLRGGELADPELRYVPPELLTGRPPDVRADVYTMGVLAYEMATGRVPFDAGTLPELLGLMLQGQAADPRELQPSLPAEAAACILTCLARDPQRRHPAARELAAAWGQTPG